MTKLANGPAKDHPSERSDSGRNKEPAVAKHARELIEFCVQETRHSLLLDLLAHPQQMPSFEELNRANPNRSASTLSTHLNKLVRYGIVNRLKIPSGERNRTSPRSFFCISQDGYTFLTHHNLLPRDEARLREQYAGIEKPDEIKELENYPRENLVLDRDGMDSAERLLLRTIVEQKPYQDERPQTAGNSRTQQSSAPLSMDVLSRLEDVSIPITSYMNPSSRDEQNKDHPCHQ